jgi:hypothetical protein
MHLTMWARALRQGKKCQLLKDRRAEVLGAPRHLLLYAAEATLIHPSAWKSCSRKSIADGEWRIIAQESNARGISVSARAKRGKMAIMRENVDHG